MGVNLTFPSTERYTQFDDRISENHNYSIQFKVQLPKLSGTFLVKNFTIRFTARCFQVSGF